MDIEKMSKKVEHVFYWYSIPIDAREEQVGDTRRVSSHKFFSHSIFWVAEHNQSQGTVDSGPASAFMLHGGTNWKNVKGE